MIRPHRSRGPAGAALTAVLSLAVVACTTDVPNTTLVPHSELGRGIDNLWDILLIGGTIVVMLPAAELV